MAASRKAMTVTVGFTVGTGDHTVLVKPEGASVAISTRRGGKTHIPAELVREVAERMLDLAGVKDAAHK